MRVAIQMWINDHPLVTAVIVAVWVVGVTVFAVWRSQSWIRKRVDWTAPWEEGQ